MKLLLCDTGEGVKYKKLESKYCTRNHPLAIGTFSLEEVKEACGKSSRCGMFFKDYEAPYEWLQCGPGARIKSAYKSTLYVKGRRETI